MILKEATTWGNDTAVVTYTRDAAAIIQQRAPHVRAGTVYSLTWPHVRPFATGKRVMVPTSAAYSTRRVAHLMDPALDAYTAAAPSLQPKRISDEIARALHNWDGLGSPPFDLAKLKATGQLTFILPLARWVASGCPLPKEDKLNTLAIDEAQDMGALELRAALGLLRGKGTAFAYGDPGQAIFSEGKGVRPDALPPAWTMADETRTMHGGYRVGDPIATLAANTLRPYYDRPASVFCADHATQLIPWDSLQQPSGAGLVLGYSRWTVAKYFRQWGLTNTAVTPKVSRADSELVLSTGHAAKGSEADDVYLLPWSRKAIKRIEANDPNALRLLYVMLTRARKRLHIPRSLYVRLKR